MNKNSILFLFWRPLRVGLSALAGLPAKTSDGLKQSLYPWRRSPATAEPNSNQLAILHPIDQKMFPSSSSPNEIESTLMTTKK